MLRIHELMQRHPYVTAGFIAGASGLTLPTVSAALSVLQRLAVVEEVTGRKRGRVFAYQKYLDVLSEGTTPLDLAGEGQETNVERGSA